MANEFVARNGLIALDNSTVSGSLNVINNITGSNALFTGTITAQTLLVQDITSSRDFVTGSTKFGTVPANTHQFTGSVSISGSLAFPTIAIGTTETNIVVADASGNLRFRSNLSLQGTTGETGAQGTTGATGAQGIQGTIGAQGVQGVQGVMGDTGAQGAIGTGTQGAIGATGAQGTQGAIGTTGAQGAIGTTGAQGAIGATGAQGVQGVQGTTGATGAQGTIGTTGAQGATGATGAQGVQGVQGIQGVQGLQGIQGTIGTTGAQGTTGAIGAQGVQGVQGTIGTTGAQGTIGTTGAQGTIGTTGAQGTIGTTGAQGSTGATGAQGATGATGAQGTIGTTGAQGTTGTTGAQGTTGTTGAQGTVGTTGAQGTIGTTGAQGTTGATGASAGITSYTNVADNRVITSVNSSTINAEANLTFDGSTLTVSGNTANKVSIIGSGSAANFTLFSVDGANGRLLEVTDDLSDSLFSVNTIAGLPVIEAFANNTVRMGQYGQQALFVAATSVGMGNEAPAYKLDVTGTIRASADVIAYSDARVKTDVITIENALDKVKALRGVTYIRVDTEDKSRKMGVIAQETEKVLPEVVQQDDNGRYSVAYGNIVGVLIEAIKEQQLQIEELKLKIK
jgi:hypothetical protein